MNSLEDLKYSVVHKCFPIYKSIRKYVNFTKISIYTQLAKNELGFFFMET